MRRQIARFARVAPGFSLTRYGYPGVVRGYAVGSMNPGFFEGGGCDPRCDQTVIGQAGLITPSEG